MKKSVFLLCLFSLNAWAINVTGFRFTDSYRYAMMDDALHDKFPGDFVLTTSLARVNVPLYETNVNYSNYKRTIVSYNNLFTLGGGYYLRNDFLISGEFGLVNNKVLGEKKTGITDGRLKAKYNFFDNKMFAFAVIPHVTLPTGKEERFVGADSFGFGGTLAGEYIQDRARVLVNAGFAHSQKNVYSIINYRNLITGQAAFSYEFSPKLVLNFEATRSFTKVDDERQSEGDYFVTFKSKIGDVFSVYGGAGIASFDGMEQKNKTFFLGIKLPEWGNAKPTPVAEPKKIVEYRKREPLRIVIKTRAQEKTLGQVVASEEIFFANNKYNITPEEREKLDSLVRKIARERMGYKHVIIEGYASKVGDSKSNLVLSENRAKEAKDYLAANGIDPRTVSIVFYGDQGTNVYRDHDKNRRVDIRLY